MQVATLFIGGMTCEGCVTSVRKALAKAGVEGAEVELGRCTLTLAPSHASLEEAVERARTAIERAGFTIES